MSDALFYSQASIGVDPVAEVMEVSINARIVGLGTSIAPRRRTCKDSAATYHGCCRSTRVTLTRILATAIHTGAEHSGRDCSIVTAAHVACVTGDKVNADTLENTFVFVLKHFFPSLRLPRCRSTRVKCTPSAQFNCLTA